MKLIKWPQKPTNSTVSSTQLHQLLNSLSDVVLILDHNHQIDYINACWQTMTAIPIEQALQQSFSQFIHPEDRSNWNQLLQNIKQDSKETLWLRLITANQDIRWCEVRIQPMHSDRIFPLSATLCDITSQVRHDQTRYANHRSLQSLIDRLPVMLYRARNNKSWTMEYLSDGCENLTGYSAEKLLNQSQLCLGSMIHQDDAAYVWDQVQYALQNQTTFDLKYRLFQADGSEIRVQDKGRGLYSDSGMILGVEGIIFQVTE